MEVRGKEQLEMRTISILYHDVITDGVADSSGLAGPEAAAYKIPREDFERHLEAIAKVIQEKPLTALELLHWTRNEIPRLLTFDDGGLSAYTCVLSLLERFGWKANFFIPTDFIGSRTFVNKQQIRELWQRGHVIGSHSCSHPTRMSHCGWERLVEEWRRSSQVLSDTLGQEVNTASVPGGYYSKKVAKAASQAGIKVLFVSEPTTSCHLEAGCLVVGRYTVWKGMPPETAAGIAAGHLSPRLAQFAFWNLKKVAKSVGGSYYLRYREQHFKRR